MEIIYIKRQDWSCRLAELPERDPPLNQDVSEVLQRCVRVLTEAIGVERKSHYTAQV